MDIRETLATIREQLKQGAEADAETRRQLESLRVERRSVGEAMETRLKQLEGNVTAGITKLTERVDKQEAESKFWRRIWSYAFYALSALVTVWQLVAPWVFRKFIGGPTP